MFCMNWIALRELLESSTYTINYILNYGTVIQVLFRRYQGPFPELLVMLLDSQCTAKLLCCNLFVTKVLLFCYSCRLNSEFLLKGNTLYFGMCKRFAMQNVYVLIKIITFAIFQRKFTKHSV